MAKEIEAIFSDKDMDIKALRKILEDAQGDPVFAQEDCHLEFFMSMLRVCISTANYLSRNLPRGFFSAFVFHFFVCVVMACNNVSGNRGSNHFAIPT